MSDTIFIRDLECSCIIGTLPEERTLAQTIIINLEISTDMSKAGSTDNLFDAVDYSCVESRVKEFVENSSFLLLEKLATEIATLILSFELISSVKVTIDKPNAPKFARSIAVQIVRSK